MAPPASSRPVLCLECRTALSEGEACDVDERHRLVRTDDPGGRQELVNASYGGDGGESRKRWRQSLSRLPLYGVVGYLGVVIVGGPIGALMVGLAIALGVSTAARSFRSQLMPVGATQPAFAQKLVAPRGTVVGECNACSPVTMTNCVAWAIELRLIAGGRDEVMYRDALTAGFEVELEGGQMARVPAGRIRVVGEIRQVVDPELPEFEEYLSEMGVDGIGDGQVDPIEHNVIGEAVVMPGDRVELLGHFEPVVNARALATSYRESAPSVLEPVNVAVIRIA